VLGAWERHYEIPFRNWAFLGAVGECRPRGCWDQPLCSETFVLVLDEN
jgi:hypothetical protein